MPIHNVWGNEAKTIIQQTFVDPWTWGELSDATCEAADMMRSFAHPIDLLLDLRKGTHIPPNALSKPMSVAKEYPSNWRLMIVVADNYLVKSLVSSIRRLFRKPFEQKLYHCTTLDEAYQVIQKQT
jgi:hypothetical protein